MQSQAVIDYKFRTFGRAVLKTEATIHILLLLLFSCYLLAVRIYYCVTVVCPILKNP